MQDHSPVLTLLARNLLRVAGRDGGLFKVSMGRDGNVQVQGPHTVVFYSGVAWTSQFVRHIYAGFFDPQAVQRPVELSVA